MRILLGSWLFCAALVAEELPVQIVQLPPTPTNDNVKIEIFDQRVLQPNSPLIIDLRSFPLGVNTNYGPLQNYPQNESGSVVGTWINGSFSFNYHVQDIDPLRERQLYFEKQMRKKLPPSACAMIGQGPFVAEVIAINSAGDSVKMRSAGNAKILQYRRKGIVSQSMAEYLATPRVILVSPRNPRYPANKPILLDFYLFKGYISPFGSHVIVYIDGKKEAALTNWTTYLIKNLPKGPHTIRLQLVDVDGNPYPTPLGSQESTITVY